MRPVNFSPGPSIVAPEVLEAAAKALLGVPEVQGLSIVEISHRLPWFEKIVESTEEALRRLLGVPDTHTILFLQGGARGQFAQVPLNWLVAGTSAAYIDTGVWARAAYDDAKTLGDARIVASGEAAGYLDEAIFVLWLDEALVPAYLAHRDVHRDRIEAYISLYLAPAAPAP